MSHSSTHKSLIWSLALALGIAVTPLAGTVAQAQGGHSQHGQPAPHAHRISMAQALQTALARVPGKVKAHELEWERGRWIYSFEIRPTGETRHIVREVNVDADSGHIVDVSTERD